MLVLFIFIADMKEYNWNLKILQGVRAASSSLAVCIRVRDREKINMHREITSDILFYNFPVRLNFEDTDNDQIEYIMYQFRKHIKTLCIW